MIRQVTKVIQSLSKKIEKFVGSKTGAKFVGKFAKNIAPGIAKAAPVIGLATSLDEIPGFKELVKVNFDINDKLYNALVKTPISKVPGIGKDLAEFMESVKDNTGFGNPIPIGRGPVPKQGAKIMGWYNDPNWYTNLDMHVAFNTPFNYPESLPLPFDGGKVRNSLAILNVAYNPWASVSMRNQRLNQTLDVLKGFRGLSGNLPYSAAKLANYQDGVHYLINEYGRLKFALKAMNYFSLVKSTLPRYIVESIGFNYKDMLDNKAKYISLLTQMGNFISASTPISGHIVSKIFHSWDAFVPDSNDFKVATLYKTNLAMITKQGGDAYSSCFAVPTNNAFIFNPKVSYESYLNGYQNYIRSFLGVEGYAAIRGDLVGAFGNNVIWHDANIQEVNEIDPNKIRIIYKFDELYLTMVQNATIISAKPAIYGADTFIYTRENALTLNDLNYDLEINEIPTNDYEMLCRSFMDVRPGNAEEPEILYYPPTDGTDSVLNAIQPKPETRDILCNDALTTSTLTIANKDKLSEGENLEILQLMSWCVDIRAHLDVAEQDMYFDARFQTHEFALFTLDVVSISEKDVVTYAIERYVTPIAQTLQSFNDVARNNTIAQLWSQMDYGVKLPNVVVFGDKSSSNLMLDNNIMGSIDKSAFDISKQYATYSLTGVGIQVPNTKRINNIVSVYGVRK